MSAWAAIRRMLVFRRPHAHDPRWFRVVSFPFLGPLLRRVSRLWVWIFLTTAFALGLGTLPLFGVLGFELAVASALFAAILGVDVGARLARELQKMPFSGFGRPVWPGRTLARSTAAAGGLAAALMLIPAAISAVRGLWIPTCDWWFGIQAYLALPMATAALAGASGHLIGVLAGPRRVVAPVLGQLLLVAIAIAAVWRFYAAPAVFTYNPILGYFPGNLYDEHVRLTSALAWSRLEQLLWVVALAGLVACVLDVPAHRARLMRRPAGHRIGPVLLALAAAGCALGLRWHSGALGYAIDAGDIEETLGGRIETPHFVIHYARTPQITEEIALIAADHEFRLAQVATQIGVWPSRKLRSFYFADREQKARLMGARDVEMAKPWRGEIYLDHRAYPHSSLRHEIAHAVAAEFGDPIFHVASRRVLGIPLLASPGLIEGLAVALDWPTSYDRPNPHESVRAMQQTIGLPSLDQLFGLSFFTVSSARGYTIAGSFLRFLLDRPDGPEQVREVYRTGGDFEAVYGVPRAQLEAEWRAMIATIVLPPPAIESAKERFRGGSVFSRPCPHAIAARRERALRVAGEGDRDGAIALLREVCSDAPDEPRYRLELGAYLYGSDDLLHRAEAEQIWTAIASGEGGVTTSLRSIAYERLARAVGGRDLELARRLVAEAAALPIDPNERRTIDGMAFVLAHAGPAAEALRGYFFPKATDATTALQRAEAAATAEPGLGFGHYLLGIQRSGAGDWPGAAAAFERALARELPGPAFVRNAARGLVIAAYRARDRSRLGLAIAALSGMASGDRWLANDWLARIAFDDTGRLP